MKGQGFILAAKRQHSLDPLFFPLVAFNLVVCIVALAAAMLV